MSYSKKIEYRNENTKEKSFEVWRKCAGCGCKQRFINTNRFRVNANGNCVDVWLIYQCKKCKHSYNLTIFERKRPTKIDTQDYERFLANDEELALQYGQDKEFFAKNNAEIIIDKKK